MSGNRLNGNFITRNSRKLLACAAGIGVLSLSPACGAEQQSMDFQFALACLEGGEPRITDVQEPGLIEPAGITLSCPNGSPTFVEWDEEYRAYKASDIDLAGADVEGHVPIAKVLLHVTYDTGMFLESPRFTVNKSGDDALIEVFQGTLGQVAISQSNPAA